MAIARIAQNRVFFHPEIFPADKNVIYEQGDGLVEFERIEGAGRAKRWLLAYRTGVGKRLAQKPGRRLIRWRVKVAHEDKRGFLLIQLLDFLYNKFGRAQAGYFADVIKMGIKNP